MDAMEWADDKVSKLDAADLALVKWSCLAGGVLLARWVPGLRKVPTWLLVALTLSLAVKPALTVTTED